MVWGIWFFDLSVCVLSVWFCGVVVIRWVFLWILGFLSVLNFGLRVLRFGACLGLEFGNFPV